ncbi:hypothetical protein WJX72_010570 [[Myrmecia] bisecta]|uniref:Uncharacterized protein n=1 Tax=[Myrmecia] bisecta TaxID=41462 RepID=A0AAW1R9N6_9CHLO
MAATRSSRTNSSRKIGRITRSSKEQLKKPPCISRLMRARLARKFPHHSLRVIKGDLSGQLDQLNNSTIYLALQRHYVIVHVPAAASSWEFPRGVSTDAIAASINHKL